MNRPDAELPHLRRLRWQVLLLAVLAGGALSIALRLAGLQLLALRWPLALAAGYLAALALQWLLGRGQRRPADPASPRSPGGGGVECGDSGLELGDLSPAANDEPQRSGDGLPAGGADRNLAVAIGCSWRPMLVLVVAAALLGALIDFGLPQAGGAPPQAIRPLRG